MRSLSPGLGVRVLDLELSLQYSHLVTATLHLPRQIIQPYRN